MARIEWHHDENGDLVFNGKVSQFDLMDLKLDRFDRRVLTEPCETAADFLLSLELIFRRLDRQIERRRAKG